MISIRFLVERLGLRERILVVMVMRAEFHNPTTG
jgi:hypothetical protein